MKNRKEYVKAIRMMLELKGMEITNIANHKALETGLIDLDTFLEAAQVLADEIMKR